MWPEENVLSSACIFTTGFDSKIIGYYNVKIQTTTNKAFGSLYFISCVIYISW